MKNNILRSVIAVFLWAGIAVPGIAQITLDGTLGTAGKSNLPGPNYEIKEAFGRKAGANLFHSFEQFNISTNESATFTGSDSVRNIISRVTGGDVSRIDGILGSAIPGADLYLLNPSGVMFGPDAVLNVSGSFHVSTADYLRMGENEQFFAMPQNNEVMSVSPPKAFGFLDGDIAAITFDGEEKITEYPTGLHVPEGESISLIGGNIEIKRGTSYESPVIDERGMLVADHNGNMTHIAADGGFAEVNESGDIIFFNSQGELLLVSPGSTGPLYPVTERIPSGFLHAPGGQISIAAVASAGEVIPTNSGADVSSCNELGNITIEKALIDSSGLEGGDVFIRCGQFFLDDGAVYSHGLMGNAGDIVIETETLALKNGALMEAFTYGSGTGGNITLRASESVSFSGHDDDFPSRVSVVSYSESPDAGDAGTVSVTTKNLSMNDRAQIASATNGGGSGGDVNIHASESVTLSGGSIVPRSSGKYLTSKAGNVFIETKNLSLNSGAWIGSYTEGQGKGGDVTIYASESVHLSGKNEAGNPSVIAVASLGKEDNAGDAGVISMESQNLTISEDGIISTKAENGGGGKIAINTVESIRLSNGNITTSVKGGADDAGDINIADPAFMTLNHSNIHAKAYEGKGGSIRITADHFIQSSDTILDASSEFGIDGSVRIESPEADISSGLTVLPSDFTDAATWMKPPCMQRSGEEVGRFVIAARDGIPSSPDDFLASPPFAFEGMDSNEFWRKGEFENIVRSENEPFSFSDEEPDASLHSLLYRVKAYQAIGHYQNALSLLAKSLPVIKKSRVPSHKALFFSILGDHYLCLGNTEEAKNYIEKAVKTARMAKNPHILASVLNNKGNFLAVRGEYQEAMMVYEESLEQIESSDNDSLKSKLLLNMLRVRVLNRDPEDIITKLNHALLQIRRLPDSHDKAADLISLSLLIQKIRENPPVPRVIEIASDALNEAKQIAELLKDSRMASYANGYLGQLYETEENYSEAITLTRRAIFFAQHTDSPELLYLWQWQSGRVFRAVGDIDNAIEAYKNATETLTPVRGEFFTGFRDTRGIFYEKVKPVYLGLADLLLKQAETSPASGEKLKKARDTMELLKRAELQDFYQDECVTAMEKKRTVMDRTPPHTALVYPIPLPDRLALLLTLPDVIKQFNVSVDSEGMRRWATQNNVSDDSEKLRQWAGRFRKRLEKRSRRFKPYAKDLYNWLIRPIEDELMAREIDTLIIVPDGALRVIPFSALHDGERFLIEKYALATIPGVTLVGPGQADLKNTRILFNGLSQEAAPRLPGVRESWENIQEIMGNCTGLLDREFTIDNLTREFRTNEYAVVIMATHGVFGGTPKDTYLETYNGRLTMDGLEKLIGYGRFREQPVQLLTLNACQTALGNERAALGLAGVAVKAGARSAVATLWSVADKAACEMITEFYRNLRTRNISKAKALQNAQKKFISGSRYRHPGYWSPFLLIGNWK